MNPRTTGVLFLVAIALGAFIYLYEVAPPGGSGEDDEMLDGGVLFPGLVADQIDWIALTSEDGVRVEIERSGGVWQGVSPRSFDADQATLDGMASQLAQLEIEGRVVRPTDAGEAPSIELADFGLGAEFNEIQLRGGGSRHGLRIGRRTPVGSNTYVTRLDDGREAIVYVSTWRVNALRKPWLELRDRRVLDFDHAAVTRIDARWPGGHVELVDTESGWRIAAPLNAVADQQTVETLLSDLAFLQADGFIDEPEPGADYGLDASPMTFELQGGLGLGDGGAFVRTLRLGAERDGQLVAERDAGQLYWIAPERLEEFPRSLLAYRDKRLARFEIADARRFTLTYRQAPARGEAAPDETAEAPDIIEGALRAGDWVTAPELMAPARVGVMLARLAALEASDIVADDLGAPERGALGLGPYRLVARVYGEADALLAEVGFGDSDPERGVFADRLDDGVVYRAAAEISDWLPLTLEALRAEFIASELGDDVDAPDVGEWAEGEDMPLSLPADAVR